MSFTTFAGYAIVADLRCGSDGQIPGVPELALGTSAEDQTVGRYEWDDDPSDGFDSGWVGVELDVSADGDVVWWVNHVAVTFSTAQFSQIEGFVFRVGTSAGDSTVSFRNISAEFFASAADTEATQTVIQDDGSASTVRSDASTAEDIVLMGPDGFGFQKAKVFAEVRMQSPNLPDPTALFGQVFVYAAAT